MTFKQFAKKVSPKIISESESISNLGFVFNGIKYGIVSQWGSGENRDNICLWGKRIGDKSGKVCPFSAEEVDGLRFYRLNKVANRGDGQNK